jgi:hypothetical protein
MTLLQTGAGVLGIKTTVPLPVGSAVTLQVQTAGAQLQAIVLAVTPQNGTTLKSASQPPAAAPGLAQAPLQPAASGQPAAPALATAAQAPVDGRTAAPSTITATVIGPPGGPLPPQAAATNAPLPAPLPGTAAPTGQAATTQPGTPSAASLTQAAAPAPGTPIASQAAAYQRRFDAVPAPLPSQPAPTAQAQAQAQAPATAPPVAAEAKLMPQAARTEAPPAPLPNGTQIHVRLVPAEGTAARQTPPLPAGTPQTAARAPLLPGLGWTGLLRLPEPPTAPAAPPQPTATTLAATIVARTPAGQTILDTLIGRILVPLPRTLENAPAGTKILLELLAGELAGAAPRAGAAASAPTTLAREWPGLREMARLLQQAPTQEVQAALERAIPRPGPRLAQQVMSFIEAATQGGARAWLGDAVSSALQRLAGTGLIERLDHDLREMLSQRAADGEWRMNIVPMLDGRDFRQIRFFERRKKRDEAERKKDDASRFVVECEHSEFGPVQLDGLMHERRMDLIVRTHEPLPADMERDILVLFGESCTGLNLAGQLFFQAVPVFPVNPLDDFGGRGVQVSA